MRNTRQREIVLDIINNSYTHPTAYDIYESCRKIISNISLGTVYRNLSFLVNEGVIKKIDIGEDICRYDSVEKKHFHFICKKCRKIIDVFDDYFVDVINIHGNIVNDYDINFSGICVECQNREE